MSYARRLVDDGIAIYLLHGVVRHRDTRIRNYSRKHITEPEFVQVVRELREAGAPVSMDHVLDAAEGRGTLPPRAFALTFDDGFSNNYDVAAPILADMKLPATFYVTSDFVDRNQMVWVDRIEWALEQVEKGTLRLPWGERAFASDDQRIAVLDEIRHNIKTDPRADGSRLASDIQEQLGFAQTYVSDHPLDRKMSWDQVAKLAATDGFTIGGHSHTHRILEYLDNATLEAEIETSLAFLSTRAGITTRHYAYPEGLAYCYSPRVIAALKGHGIACSPSAEDGVNELPADPFRLKRIFVV